MSGVSSASASLSAQLKAIIEFIGKPEQLKGQDLKTILEPLASGLDTLTREMVKLNVDGAIAGTREPARAAQATAYGSKEYRRPEFKKRPTTLGTVSQVSRESRLLSAVVPMGGFTEDEDQSQSPPTQSDVPTTSVLTPASTRAPPSIAPPASVAPSASVSMGGFADDSHAEPTGPASSAGSVSASYTVPDYIRPHMRMALGFAEEELGVTHIQAAKLMDGTNGKPVSASVMSLSHVIEFMIEKDSSSVAKVLGYETGEEADMNSDLVKALKSV